MGAQTAPGLPAPRDGGGERVLGDGDEEQVDRKKKAIAPDALDVTPTLARDHNPAPAPPLRRLEVRLRPLPPPDRLEDAPSPEGVWIVSDDGEGASIALAQALTARGMHVALLRFPVPVIPERPPLPDGMQAVILADLSEAHLERRLAAVGPVTGFVHVEPGLGRARPTVNSSEPSETGPSNTTDARFFPADTKTRLKHVFLIAKHLKSALDAAARNGRASFVTVTRMDGALGLGETTGFDAVAGGFAGLTKTLNLEWPAIFCRAIDISPQFDAAQAADAILAELSDPNRRLVEVGHGPHGRVTVEASRQNTVDGRQGTKTPAPSTVYGLPSTCTLVSGGGKGITSQCVIKLAERYGGTYILLGRSSIEEPEPAWAHGVEDEATLRQHAIEAAMARGERPTPAQVQREINRLHAGREIEETLRAVARAGGRAEYLSVDVTDGVALSSAVEDATNRLGVRVTGILHGAGVLADKRIEHKTGDDFERVYNTKVTGLENLLACVPEEQLEHLILFSSVAGFYGNVGQADYALANEILNKTAHLVTRRHPHCRALAIDWGPWDGGMVTPELKRLFAERNIDVIPVEAGTALLADELAASAPRTPQIVVGAPLVAPAPEPDGELRTHHLRRTLTLDANPFLRDHVIGGQAVLPTVCAVAWMVNACEQLYPGYTFFSGDAYKALKGIVFDETLADAYTLELKETVKTREELVFEGLIRSQTPAGKPRRELPRYHYSARITLLRQVSEAPVFTAFDLSETESMPGERLYAEQVLFHGPSFRGVERVLNIGPGGLTLRCLLPEISRETQGQFPVQTFNPYLTDVQLQSLLIWAALFKQSPGLPLRIQRGEQFRPVQFGEPVYVTLTVQSSSDTSLVADVTVHDAQGLVYSRVTGAEITLSPRLNQLFQQNRL
ncbi:MAG: SDR family NAD(P)-dependent oxidoreductase [Anaerolineae bacterium]